MSNVIYWTDIVDFPDPAEEPVILDGLTPQMVDKILSLKQIISRKQCLCSCLMQKYVAESHGKSVADIIIGEHGKPLLEGVHFNVSHSRNLVVCAVSDIPVGCDVERIKQAPLHLEKKYFHPEEISFRDELSPDDSPDKAFFRLWCAKESYLKMTGEGLSFGLKNIKVCLTTNKLNRSLVFREGNILTDLPKEIFLPDYENYVIFVCTNNRDFDPIIKHFSI